jgi:predicted nucleic acid-binding protein
VNANAAVADSSALIVFHQIGRLELLQAVLGRLAVPPAVARDVAPSLGVLPAWVELRRAPPNPDLPGYLDDGERDAIALALHLGASTIVLDELPGRRVAMALRLDVVGSLGLLVRAKRAGLIRDVRPIMDAMLSWGLFASDSLYRQILAAAGELN